MSGLRQNWDGVRLHSALPPQAWEQGREWGKEGKREQRTDRKREKQRTIWDSLILGLWDHGIGRCATVCPDFLFFTQQTTKGKFGLEVASFFFFLVGSISGLLDGAWRPSDSHSGTKNELSGEWMRWVCLLYVCKSYTQCCVTGLSWLYEVVQLWGQGVRVKRLRKRNSKFFHFTSLCHNSVGVWLCVLCVFCVCLRIWERPYMSWHILV